jgi:diaminohydroxyphosphoribosylaminopyrimidine deaminase/5-amino-6-(5-phosphoribosylamino)uracil reductase
VPDDAGHSRWMAEAIGLARKGWYSTAPNPRVGCIIVADGISIGQGWHEVTGGPHAEINAINSAEIPSGCDFYITLEPCSHQGRTAPCVDAVIACQPARVFIAMLDPNPKVAGRGVQKLRQSGIEVITDVLENEARKLNRGFLKRMEHGLPFVSIKMAASLDGRTALANGASKWITGEAARRDVQFLRAQCSAILTTAKTIVDDDPSLNLRLNQLDLRQKVVVRQPYRVIIDSKLCLTGKEKVFSQGGDIFIYTLSDDKEKIDRLCQPGVEVIRAEAEGVKICLPWLLRDLASREMNEIHSECGQRMAGALVKQNLADQIVLYQAPHLMGCQSQGLFDLGELTDMKQRINGRIEDFRQVGADLRITLALGGA